MFSSGGPSVRFLTRYDGEVSEPLVGRRHVTGVRAALLGPIEIRCGGPGWLCGAPGIGALRGAPEQDPGAALRVRLEEASSSAAAAAATPDLSPGGRGGEA